MAFIDTRTFDIFFDINDSDKDFVFECDDAIAPAIRILNLKGYTTTYCCGGHPYPSRIELISRKSPKKIRSIVYGVYDVKEVTLDDLKDTYHYDMAYILINNSKKKKNKHLYLVKALQEVDKTCYISFKKGHRPKKLPKGWKCDEDDADVIRHKIKFKFTIKFFHKQAKAMENLVDWAEALPMYK